MNKEKIIEMAKEYFSSIEYDSGDVHKCYEFSFEELVNFAEMVRDDYSKKHARLWLKRIDDAVNAEREAIEKRVMELDETLATRVNVVNKAIRTSSQTDLTQVLHDAIWDSSEIVSRGKE